MTSLTCPKCQGDMRTYERNGITVDQCTECRGIFLDRGELEHLVEADVRASTAGAPSARPGADPRSSAGQHGGDDRYRDRDRYDRDDDDDHHHSGYGHQRKRKKSWVDELFG